MDVMGYDKDISEKRMKRWFNSCFGLEPELCFAKIDTKHIFNFEQFIRSNSFVLLYKVWEV